MVVGTVPGVPLPLSVSISSYCSIIKGDTLVPIRIGQVIVTGQGT
jgi:hypothetical protein